MTKSNLVVRLLTAAVAVPLLLALLFLGPAWGWYLLVLFGVVIAASELFAMTHPGDRVSQAIGAASAAASSAAVYLWGSDPRVLMTLMIVVPIAGALLPLWRLGQIPTAGLRMLSGIAGPFYVGVLLTTLALIRRDAADLGARYVLMTLTFAWLADTGGYFFGRFLGKTKLYEAVSPKKTRAGFVGSLVGAVSGGLAAHLGYLPQIPLVHALVLALVAGALGQFGDLAESLLKRSTGIKDSGSIIPGHGGILDRVDALLIASPIVYLYILWHAA